MYYYQSQRSSEEKKKEKVNYVTDKINLNKKPKAIVKIFKQRVN